MYILIKSLSLFLVQTSLVYINYTFLFFYIYFKIIIIIFYLWRLFWIAPYPPKLELRPQFFLGGVFVPLPDLHMNRVLKQHTQRVQINNAISRRNSWLVNPPESVDGWKLKITIYCSTAWEDSKWEGENGWWEHTRGAVGAHPVRVTAAEACVRAVGSMTVALIWALGSGYIT